jgi:hypothetical protein
MSKKNEVGHALIKLRLSNKNRNKKFTWVITMNQLHQSLKFVLNLMFKMHTSELQDGTDWNRINFTSVTEQNSLDEFLSTAELAGTDFEAGVCIE